MAASWNGERMTSFQAAAGFTAMSLRSRCEWPEKRGEQRRHPPGRAIRAEADECFHVLAAGQLRAALQTNIFSQPGFHNFSNLLAVPATNYYPAWDQSLSHQLQD